MKQNRTEKLCLKMNSNRLKIQAKIKTGRLQKNAAPTEIYKRYIANSGIVQLYFIHHFT